MAFARAMSLDEVWAGELTPCVIEGRRILLIRKGDSVLAFEDRCAHLGVPLSRGRLERDVLTCGAHEWQYDAATGKGINPVSARLRKYEVKIVDGQIWIDVQAPGQPS
jgi:toluene monooxygenase system ferredoxin subunit